MLRLDSAGLESLLTEAIEAGGARDRPTIASVTTAVDCADPVATVFASRRAVDPWFCWQEPDRGFALAALGRAHSVVARGRNRFREVAAECAHLSGDAIVRGSVEEGPTNGLVWTGGFAFDDEGAGSPAWSSFEPAAMILPELSIQKGPEGAFLTLNALTGPGVEPGRAGADLLGRVGSLVSGELGLLDPHPTIRSEIESAISPDRFERAVGDAVERIKGGEIAKVVLAREVRVRSGSAHDPGSVFTAIREGFPSCFNFCVGTPEAAFIGASPELLVRCVGRGATTVGLAGSTRRSSDPAVDDHLAQKLLASSKDRGEQELVVRQIVKALSRLSVWVEAAAEPEIIKVANIQHLGTPVFAQLAEPHTAIELAGLLHPTPAVGGEPWNRAEKVMAEVEQLDRGWYAGPVGWMDGSGDGEFCVGLRSALLRDRDAHLYAGVGVVADSDPAEELAETEIKLNALLPLLEG